jgi:dTDP-4-amino-4,6-dideoxygalactose transaminase
MPVCFDSIEKRDEIYLELVRNGIKPRKYFFPLTVNFDYFKQKGVNLVEKYNLHHAADIANRVLCLPLYPDLEMSVVDDVVNIINKVVK